MLSIFKNDSSKQILLEESPWKFGNIDKDLVKRDEATTDKDMIDFYNEVGIEKDTNGLATGLDFVFTELWSSLHKRDTATIAGMCEGELRQAFTDFYDALDEEDCILEALDEEEPEPVNKLKIIDFCYIRGTFTRNRAENRRLGVYDLGFKT